MTEIATTNSLIELAIFTAAAVPLIYYDLRERRIPDFIVIPAALILLALRLFLFGSFSALSLIGAAVGFGLFALLHVFFKGRIGLGDARLSGLIALLLGFWGWVLAIFAASLSGALFVLVQARRGRMSLRESIPFAPFLAGGAVLSFFIEGKIFQLLDFAL
jgi:leader peptidase (prepilin peptidase)/N-methyltransferase